MDKTCHHCPSKPTFSRSYELYRHIFVTHSDQAIHEDTMIEENKMDKAKKRICEEPKTDEINKSVPSKRIHQETGIKEIKMNEPTKNIYVEPRIGSTKINEPKKKILPTMNLSILPTNNLPEPKPKQNAVHNSTIKYVVTRSYFDKIYTMVKRFVRMNQPGRMECSFCDCKFKHALALTKHLVGSHSQAMILRMLSTKTKYRCGYCSLKFLWQHSLIQHILAVHAGKKIKPKLLADPQTEKVNYKISCVDGKVYFLNSFLSRRTENINKSPSSNPCKDDTICLDDSEDDITSEEIQEGTSLSMKKTFRIKNIQSLATAHTNPALSSEEIDSNIVFELIDNEEEIKENEDEILKAEMQENTSPLKEDETDPREKEIIFDSNILITEVKSLAAENKEPSISAQKNDHNAEPFENNDNIQVIPDSDDQFDPYDDDSTISATNNIDSNEMQIDSDQLSNAEEVSATEVDSFLPITNVTALGPNIDFPDPDINQTESVAATIIKPIIDDEGSLSRSSSRISSVIDLTKSRRNHTCTICLQTFERSYQLKRHLFIGDHTRDEAETITVVSNDTYTIKILEDVPPATNNGSNNDKQLLLNSGKKTISEKIKDTLEKSDNILETSINATTHLLRKLSKKTVSSKNKDTAPTANDDIRVKLEKLDNVPENNSNTVTHIKPDPCTSIASSETNQSKAMISIKQEPSDDVAVASTDDITKTHTMLTECELCHELLFNIKEHMLLKHKVSKAYHQCEFCNLRLPTHKLKELQVHMAGHGSTKCNICSVVNKEEVRLWSHSCQTHP